tara:strand:+ start:5121 stop:5537 length:417 start_codon:yes stop_codon:yes gene_type:complete
MTVEELENWEGRYVFVKGDPCVYHMTAGANGATYFLSSCVSDGTETMRSNARVAGSYHRTSFLKDGRFGKKVYPFWLQVDDEIQIRDRNVLVNGISCLYYTTGKKIVIIAHLEAHTGKVFTLPLTNLNDNIKFIEPNG